MYDGLGARLADYPIPALRLPPGDGRTFLDIGCSWGRWSIAAARSGYRVVGIDPSLVAIRAARRVARQLGVDAYYLVGDARHLPFADATFATVFSYSVIQHFSKPDAQAAFAEIGRVLGAGGESLIQMPNAFGLRSFYHQGRRLFRDARLFEVRYWTVGELRAAAERLVGPTTVTVDGFFSLNPQPTDLPFLRWQHRVVVQASEALRRASVRFRALTYVADSIYVASRRLAK
jgi:SAM-dependent methyltransferase